MRTIEEVLNEMAGANYAVTNAQICEVMEIHSAEVAAVNIRIREAYEAGRRHDRAALEKILEGETDDGRMDM
jgi:archaellum biogenesis ATPase FlaH